MQVEDNAAFAGWLRVSRVTSMDEPILATPPTEESDSAMMALSSDGSLVVVAYQDELEYRLVLRDTATGELLDEFSADGQVAMFPEFSPDSSSLVITLAASLDSEIAVRDGNISILTIDERRFGQVTEVVPALPETAHFYPTWSPDGEWIAFVSGPGRPAEQDPAAKSYDQRDSRLWLVHRSGGTAYELKAASGPLHSTSTWPKFSPFVQCAEGGTDCPEAERTYFLTFSSRRDYGILAPSADGVSASSQLWLAAIDLRLLGTGDPSLPPIWLPYQNEKAANHLGFWTEALKCNERVPCSLGTECISGNCVVLVK